MHTHQIGANFFAMRDSSLEVLIWINKTWECGGLLYTSVLDWVSGPTSLAERSRRGADSSEHNVGTRLELVVKGSKVWIRVTVGNISISHEVGGNEFSVGTTFINKAPGSVTTDVSPKWSSGGVGASASKGLPFATIAHALRVGVHLCCEKLPAVTKTTNHLSSGVVASGFGHPSIWTCVKHHLSLHGVICSSHGVDSPISVFLCEVDIGC